MTQSQNDYWKEFELNLKYQLKDFKIKEFITVGYQIENVLCFTLLIPFPVKKKSLSKQKLHQK
jgi:hypothetical protein